MRSTTKKESSGLALVPAATVIISLFAIGAVASRGLRGARRELEAPVAAALPEVRVESPRPIATASAKKKHTPRSIIGALTFLFATISISLLATGGSYALWNGAVAVKGGTLGTGSIGLTINGGTNYTLPLPTTNLAPGKSVVASATFANTGSVALSDYIASTTLTSNTNALASSLTMTVTPVASTGACVAGLSGGISSPLSTYGNASAPYSLAGGATQVYCFQLTLSSSAPASAEGGSTTFQMNVVANQVHS